MGARAHVIVLGNEKGGSGKSTTAMHLLVALLRDGHSVGALDLDLRQQSFFRYLTNRDLYAKRIGSPLLAPRRIEIRRSELRSTTSARIAASSSSTRPAPSAR
jgi:chromosome partitioning protein